MSLYDMAYGRGNPYDRIRPRLNNYGPLTGAALDTPKPRVTRFNRSLSLTGGRRATVAVNRAPVDFADAGSAAVYLGFGQSFSALSLADIRDLRKALGEAVSAFERERFKLKPKTLAEAADYLKPGAILSYQDSKTDLWILGADRVWKHFRTGEPVAVEAWTADDFAKRFTVKFEGVAQ